MVTVDRRARESRSLRHNRILRRVPRALCQKRGRGRPNPKTFRVTQQSFLYCVAQELREGRRGVWEAYQTSLERNAEEELGLVLVAFEEAGRIEEMLVAPARVADFGLDVYK